MSRSVGFLVIALAAHLIPVNALGAAEPRQIAIEQVSVSRPFFNPTLKQVIKIAFAVEPAGRLSVVVLDRDGYPVRMLASQQAVQAGNISFGWDGKNDRGDIVPDEAYSLKIDLESDAGNASYFPALQPADDFEIKANYYDRRRATLSYRLPKPARVHIQAGCATADPKTKKVSGPVLKTIANREPRPGGAVVDYWDGLDESGTVRVPDLPNFVIGIAGTSLPENAMLATGNRAVRFLDQVSSRTGVSLLPAQQPSHHHMGLGTLADTSPGLSIALSKGVWEAGNRTWRFDDAEFVVDAKLLGPSTPSFAKQPGKIYIFLDQSLVKQLDSGHQTEVKIPLSRLTSGSHILAVNWASEFGPTAANALRIQVSQQLATNR